MSVASPNVVDVAVRGGPFPLSRAVMLRRAYKMLAARGLQGVELSIALVDDALIESLNSQYRNKAQPTDVLAFPSDAPPTTGAPRLLGDVIISVPTAHRQARRRKRALIDEATHLLAHGLLHLLGYDHQTDSEEAAMNAATRGLVEAAGRRARPEHS